MAVDTFVLSDKRPFVKVLELMSKQMIKVKTQDSELEVIRLNLQLDKFSPYSIDKSQCRGLLDGMLHALDVSINFPTERVRKNSRVKISTAEFFYGLIEGIPSLLLNKLDCRTRAEQQKLIFQVFSDIMENNHGRSPIKTHLVKYLAQENMSFITEVEALNTFLDLLDRYSRAINSLSRLVYLHRSIQEWSEAVVNAEDSIGKETEEDKVALELGNVMVGYNEYITNFDSFQALGAQDRASIYIEDIQVESEPLNWISRLESPGFLQVGIDIIYMPVVSEHDFAMAMTNRLKDLLGSQAYRMPAFQMGPEACSSPRHSREHIPLTHPEPARVTTAPTVSFAVSTASTPTTASISAPNIMTTGNNRAVVPAPAVLHSTGAHGAQVFPFGLRDRPQAAGRGTGPDIFEDVSEIRRPVIDVGEYNAQCNQLMQHWNVCFNSNRSVLQGYPDSLERQAQELEKEVKKCVEDEDSDAIDYLLTYNLERFQDDITRARQGGVIDDVTAARYYKHHARFVQRLKPLKRVLIKKIKDCESKKTLANLHKQNLPLMADSLDSKEWCEQVNFIMRALKDEEDNNPILQNRLKEMVRSSIKSDPLKPLYKVISNMGDIDEMIHTIVNYCSNQSNIMSDLKDRLLKMKSPKTKLNMYSNSMLIIELISLLQVKDMVRVTPVFIYNLMVEKSLSSAHLPKFENFLNEALRKDNEQEEEEDGMTEMERKRYLLANPQARKKNLLNFKPLTDLTNDKMALLNDYLITHCTSFNLESNFTESDKQLNTFFTDNNIQGEPLECNKEENVDAEDLETQAFYAKSVKNRAEGHGEFCEVYLKHDRDYCKQVIANPKYREKLRRCPCGVGAPHEVLYGSMRYCPHFLNLGTYNARKEFIKLKRGCMKCMRGNHLSSSCRYKPSSCYYCRIAGKQDKGHSPGMCCAFNDTEFTEVIKVLEAKLKSQAKGTEKNANVFTAGDEGSVSDDEDLETEEDLVNALNCHKVSRYMTLEQEIKFCEQNGMKVEVHDQDNFKITLEDERLQAIGEVKLRLEPKEGEESRRITKSSEVLGLSDTGSESTFVTHHVARKHRFRKLRILKLKLNTLGGLSNISTFMYQVPIFDYKKKKYVLIEAAGVDHIGRAKMMSSDLQTTVNKVLKPYNLHLADLEVPRFDDLGLIIGNDNAAIQIEDNAHLNKLSRPQNIRFYNSPVMQKPLVVGRAYGDEPWTEDLTEESVSSSEVVMPMKSPVKQWEGFDGIRTKADIIKSKETLPWNDMEDSDCWDNKEPQLKSVQSYYDSLLSDDEIFDSDASDEEDEEERYLSCFMVNTALCMNNTDYGVTTERDSNVEGLSQEIVKLDVSSFVSNPILGDVQTAGGFEPTQSEQDSEMCSSKEQNEEADDNVGPDDGGTNRVDETIDEDQLRNDSIRLRAPTVRDLNILDNYLSNEGNLPVQPSKCQECLEINCKQCIKYARSTPEETAILQEMKDNISSVVKDDGSIQYIVKYVTDKPLSSLFTPSVSNYSQALSQSRQVYAKFMSTPEGRAAVNNMVERGKAESHFKYLTQEETKQVLKGPHNFVSQTVAYKEASHSTKIRHVSNPSCLNRELGSSLNISQKNPGNIGNNADWPLNSFFMYSAAYSADVKSAYRKLQVCEEDRNFQLLILFDFSKDKWMDHPLVVQQVNLPFGVKQSGVFLELVLYEVGTKASSPLARIIICHFRLVDNLLYSFQTRELLETTGEEIFQLLEHHNLHLQNRYSTSELHHYDFSIEQPQEVILGYKWNKQSDTISPATVLSHGRSRDGSKGRLLKDYKLDAHAITKRTILAIISQLWDPSGIFFSILKMSLKTIYSQICLAHPGKSKIGYDTPVIASSDYLAHIAANVCNSLTHIHQIEPLKRNIVPQHFQVHHLVLSKDGSSYGMSSTLHVVSRNTQNHEDFHSRLARAANRAKITSAPTSEALSYVLGLNLVSQWLESTYHMFYNDRDFFDCFVLGDSQSALLGLYTPPKDILFRSVQSKVLDLALNISTKFSKIRLQFMWDVASNNPSDLNSKLSDKIVEMSNSQFWRNGPAIFLSHEQLQNSTYATFCKEAKRFIIVKQLSTQPPMGLEDDKGKIEDIAQVCLSGSRQNLLVEGCNTNKAVDVSVGVTQGSPVKQPDGSHKLLEACLPPTEGVSKELAHTPPSEGHSAQPLQSPINHDKDNSIGNHSNLAQGCTPTTEKACSNKVTTLTCEVKQVQCFQGPSPHGSEAQDPSSYGSEGTLQVNPQDSGDLSNSLALLKDNKVTPVPSCNVQTNNKQNQLKLIYQTQCHVDNTQNDKSEIVGQGDGVTANGKDDLPHPGNDDNDEGLNGCDNDHLNNDIVDDGTLCTKNNETQSIYDWDLDGGHDNTPTPRLTWFDNTPELVKLSTLSHEFLFQNNVSLSQLFHSEGLNIGLPHSPFFPIGENANVYQSLLDKSSSLGVLLSRTVYQHINLLVWIEKARLKLKNEKIPIFDLQKKFQMAWHFLLINSQKLYPPGRMLPSHEVFMENGLSCIGLKVDFRLFRPLILPLVGKDEKLLQLIFQQAHIFKGLDGRNYHRGVTSTASQIRSSPYGVFFLNSQKVVSHFIQNCILCAKDKRGTIISKIASYHRLRVEAPFSRISVDIIGPWLVKASCNSRALIKVHALIAVCISTGMLTHIMTDSITTEAIIRALWVLQMRHAIQITHVHSDRGTQFLKLGTVGSIPDGSPGPFIRLLIMLNAVRISAAQGQSSNVVEPSVRRLKELWRTGNRHINENRGSSFCSLDWLLSQLCSDLNKVPLDPSISDLAPADFSLAYRQMPVGFDYHDKTGNKKMLNKMSSDYKQLSSGFKNNRTLSPYLWRTKYLGQITRNCNVNDVVFIRTIRKLGLVCGVKLTQLQIHYVDGAGKKRSQWFKKSDVTHLLGGSTLLSNQVIPEHDITQDLTSK